MGLFDGSSEEPQSKIRRYLITGVVLALLLGAGVRYVLRYHAEKKTVARFLDTVVRGDLQAAYRIWQPKPTYTFQDFLEDWGPQGFYGPVQSYRIAAAQRPRGGSGVIVVVELSPLRTFPAEQDDEGNRQMKEVRIWVEGRDQSLSFPP